MNFKELITNYLQSTGRANIKLEILASKMYTSKGFIRDFEKYLSAPCRPMHYFKILLLLHHCLIGNLLNWDFIDRMLNKLSMKPVTDIFQTMLEQKVNGPYKLYLQKRIIDGDNDMLTQSQIVYQYINTLSRGSSFGDFLYIFGRYYQQKYQFAIDFNILLGRDLEKLYAYLAKKIKKIQSNQAIICQIQNIHQKLYVVYYNCYYYKYLKGYVPKWINTDKLYNKTPSRNKILSNKSIASVSTANNSPASQFMIDDIVSNKNMAQSVLIQSSFNGKYLNQFEQSQLDLMKSMERVLEEMDD